MDKVYDFIDFTECLDEYGKSVLMKEDDFMLWESGLSQGRCKNSHVISSRICPLYSFDVDL